MSISRNHGNSMSAGRPSGWTAFAQREKGVGPLVEREPFPAITNITCSGSGKKFPGRIDKFKEVVMRSGIGEKHGSKQIMVESDGSPVKMLSYVHRWADRSLVEDILAAVNNDVEQASVLLKAMVSSDVGIKEDMASGASGSSVGDFCDGANKCLEKKADGAHEVEIARKLFTVPVEPEWEEDDIYLSHRKDALKAMRAASHHSRAASNAFMRGDHVSAQHHSARAREEWMAAEKLNAQAAGEILHIRNINNDVWKLDLHGLHATEAVSALKEHLHKIESYTVMKQSSSADELTKLGSGIVRSPSLEYLSCMDLDIKTKENKVMPHQRRTVLDVITGKGSHSREQAAIPIAVRSFLIENGYRFEEARPGVIAVRLKFRQNNEIARS